MTTFYEERIDDEYEKSLKEMANQMTNATAKDRFCWPRLGMAQILDDYIADKKTETQC